MMTDEKIIQIVRDFGLSTKERNYEFYFPRIYFMNWLREKMDFSYKKIGGYFYRPHSTVMSAIASRKRLVEVDDSLYNEYTKKIREVLKEEEYDRMSIDYDIAQIQSSLKRLRAVRNEIKT